MKGIIIAEGLRHPDAGTRPWVEKMMTTLLAFSEFMLKKKGNLVMQVHGFTGEGREWVIPIPSQDEEERRSAFRAVKHFFKNYGIIRYFLISETWGVNYDTTDPLQIKEARHRIDEGGGGSLEHHPRRWEALMITYNSYDFQRGEIWEMLRDKEGNYTGLTLRENVAEEIEDYDKRKLQGRVNDLLPRPEKKD